MWKAKLKWGLIAGLGLALGARPAWSQSNAAPPPTSFWNFGGEGADASKPGSCVSFTYYVANDTKIIYYCWAGSWTAIAFYGASPVTFGAAGTAGSVQMFDQGANAWTIQTPNALAGSYVLTAPTAIPLVNQGLYCSGLASSTCTLSWFYPATTGAAATKTCSSQVLTALSVTTDPTCTTVTSAYVDGSIPKVLASTQSTTDTCDANGACSNNETAFSQSYSVPGGTLVANRTLRLTLGFQVVGANNSTLTVALRWGGIGGTVIYQSTSANASAVTTSYGLIFLISGTAAAGNPANIITTPVGGGLTAQLGRSVTAQPVGVDTSSTKVLTVTAKWGTGATANTITLQNFLLEQLN